MLQRWLVFVLVTFSLVLSACDEGEECPAEAPMITISVPADGIEYQIDKYEASRFDATATDEGSGNEIGCSVGGVKPWGSATYQKARSACRANGKRLCTRDEWNRACRSTGLNNDYPYGKNFDPDACNGLNMQDSTSPTGAFAECVTELNEIFDMVGNVREWVDEAPGFAGGGFTDQQLNLSCDNVVTPLEGTDHVPGQGTGFRCCK